MGQKDPRVMGSYAGRLLIFFRAHMLRSFFRASPAIGLYLCLRRGTDLPILPARAANKGYRLYQGAIMVCIL